MRPKDIYTLGTDRVWYVHPDLQIPIEVTVDPETGKPVKEEPFGRAYRIDYNEPHLSLRGTKDETDSDVGEV
jgi:hypothetical protein